MSKESRVLLVVVAIAQAVLGVAIGIGLVVQANFMNLLASGMVQDLARQGVVVYSTQAPNSDRVADAVIGESARSVVLLGLASFAIFLSSAVGIVLIALFSGRNATAKDVQVTDGDELAGSAGTAM